MFYNWNQFITWEKSSTDTIDVKKIYIDMAEDVMAGIMLSQIVYWYLPSKSDGKSKLKVKKECKRDKKMHFWIAKPREEWYEEIRFTKHNVNTAMKKLENKKIIIRQDNMFDGKRTAHIRLNVPIFLKLLNEQLGEINEQVDEFEQYLQDELNTKNEEEKEVINTKNEGQSLEPHGLTGMRSTGWTESGQSVGRDAVNRLDGIRSNITESTSESTSENKIKEYNLSINQVVKERKIRDLLIGKIDRLIADGIEPLDIQSHYEHVSGIYGLNEYVYVLNAVLSQDKKINSIAGLMDDWLKRNREKYNKQLADSKMKDVEPKKQLNPKWYEEQKKREQGTQVDKPQKTSNDNLDEQRKELEEFFKQFSKKDKTV